MPAHRRAPFIVCLVGLLLGIPGLALGDDLLRERLETLRADPRASVAGTRLASAPLLDDLYRERDYEYAWKGRSRVDALLALADETRADGLRPEDFHSQAIRELLGSRAAGDLTGAARVDAELVLSDALLRLIHHLRHGKVDPQALDRRGHQADGPFSTDLVRDLGRALDARDLGAEVHALTPKAPFYARLKQGLTQYRALAAAGGWPQVPPGGKIEPGKRDARVPAVRERLGVTGEHGGAEPADPRLYDRELEKAVRRFQERHHLGVDGVIGPATLTAMNVTAEERVGQIRVNLERMRWVHHDLPDDYLLVDIPGQEAQLLRGGEAVWSSRVIVGRADRQTPIFRDQVEYLEFNPTWTVPPTILKKDILPAARNDPQAVRAKGLTVIDRNGRVVDPAQVDWDVSAGSFPYTLRQPPGDRNALGQVKFMFPNRFSVYLHDTPDRRLFSRTQRLLSSGCVRVDRPMELAELLLAQPERWNQESFERLIRTGKTRTVHLTQPMPIILSYWTADVGPDGEVRFRPDIYDRDAQVLTALDGMGPFRLVYIDPRPQPEPEPEAQPPAAPGTDVLSEVVRTGHPLAPRLPASAPQQSL